MDAYIYTDPDVTADDIRDDKIRVLENKVDCQEHLINDLLRRVDNLESRPFSE